MHCGAEVTESSTNKQHHHPTDRVVQALRGGERGRGERSFIDNQEVTGREGGSEGGREGRLVF
jgi:hypothetical protein